MTDYPYTFFVLNGLINGEAGNEARKAGPSHGPLMVDGWYFHPSDDDVDGVGPFKDVEEVRQAVATYKRVRRPGLVLLGHCFQTMDKMDGQAFAGAEPGTLICHAPGDVILLWCPVSQTITEVLPSADEAITEHGEENRVWRFEAV